MYGVCNIPANAVSPLNSLGAGPEKQFMDGNLLRERPIPPHSEEPARDVVHVWLSL